MEAVRSCDREWCWIALSLGVSWSAVVSCRGRPAQAWQGPARAQTGTTCDSKRSRPAIPRRARVGRRPRASRRRAPVSPKTPYRRRRRTSAARPGRSEHAHKSPKSTSGKAATRQQSSLHTAAEERTSAARAGRPGRSDLRSVPARPPARSGPTRTSADPPRAARSPVARCSAVASHHRAGTPGRCAPARAGSCSCSASR